MDLSNPTVEVSVTYVHPEKTKFKTIKGHYLSFCKEIDGGRKTKIHEASTEYGATEEALKEFKLKFLSKERPTAFSVVVVRTNYDLDNNGNFIVPTS